ncbi:Pectinesterase 1 [Dichanthelium oligosanthes]|uniref:Pectinesterase n=1 Tax=Dichanthelium oligosanthes TaxID=888268 RepID=A0A1E5UUY6_9POAL|nr:Pectinesterase 1 [Dichanthelium oligosanthes]
MSARWIVPPLPDRFCPPSSQLLPPPSLFLPSAAEIPSPLAQQLGRPAMKGIAEEPTMKGAVIGATKTVITGSKSFMMNIRTKDTATMEVIGKGFLMCSVGVENTAGAKNHQVVALRVQSDMSAFYQCQFDGYQDTYTHMSRQYYFECVITGTIDFIFGNAQVVLQNCLI